MATTPARSVGRPGGAVKRATHPVDVPRLGCESFALRQHGVRLLLSAPAPKKGYSKRTELSFGVSSGDSRVVVHDGSSRLFIRRFENCNPGIDPSEGRTGND